MNTAIYVRVSTDQQDHDSQLRVCRAYSTQYTSHTVLYTDTGSGSTMDRPEVQRLLTDVRAGRVGRLIVFEMSRLSRDMLTVGLLTQELYNHKVELHVVSEGGKQNMAGAINQFIALAKGLTAQLERENIVRRTKAGLAATRARGTRLGAPVGNSNRRGKFKPFDNQIVQKIRQLRQLGMSINKVAEITGTNYSKVQRILKRHKVTVPNYRKTLSKGG